MLMVSTKFFYAFGFCVGSIGTEEVYAPLTRLYSLCVDETGQGVYCMFCY